MARIKFTAGRVRDHSCELGKSQSFLWDTDAPGLAVRATANGAKSYIFQGKLDSTSIRVTIGDVKSWDIETGSHERPGAREEARRLQTLIDQGIDPRHAKADKIAQIEVRRTEDERKDLTVAELWPIYIEARRHQWSDRHKADHDTVAQLGGQPVKRGKKGQKIAPGTLAALMPYRLSEITKGVIKAWLRDESAKRPTQTALAFRLFRAFINWCNDTPAYAGLAGESACSSRVSKENLPKSKAKKDCLQKEQLNGWFSAVGNIANPTISSFLQILLLTGPRREELAELKWADVDFKWNSLTIHDKVEGERTIPMTPYVRTLLLELKRINETPPKVRILHTGAKQRPKNQSPALPWKPSGWVFSSPSAKSGRLQEPRPQHCKACSVAGIEGLTLHGLRRSFGTLAEWVECPAGVVAQIQGHKPSATAEKHYRQRPLDLLRMWHTKIEEWMLENAGIEFKQAKPGLQVVNL